MNVLEHRSYGPRRKKFHHDYSCVCTNTFARLHACTRGMSRPTRSRTPAHIVFALGIGFPHLGETGPLSQGVQAGRKALRTRHINGMEVRKKRPTGFKKRLRGFK